MGWMRIVESRLIAGDENIQIDDVTTIRYTLGSNFFTIENGDFVKVADRPAVSEAATDGDPIFALNSGPEVAESAPDAPAAEAK